MKEQQAMHVIFNCVFRMLIYTGTKHFRFIYLTGYEDDLYMREGN